MLAQTRLSHAVADGVGRWHSLRVRRSIRLFAILVLSGVGAAQRLADVYQPTLWKLSSASNSIYLLGSVHVGTPDMYPLPKAIENAFAASPVLLVEQYLQNTGGEIDPATIRLFQDEGLYPDEDTLWKHTSPEARQRLTEFAKNNHLPDDLDVDDLEQMRPWLVAIFVEIAPPLNRGMTFELGIDQHFIDEAEHADDSKRIVGIESLEFQVQVLSRLPDEVQARWLEFELGLDPKGWDAVEKVLVAGRNGHMADVAEQFLKGQEQAFMVVGLAHVVGEQGVVHLLELRGYKAEQVKDNKKKTDDKEK